MSFADRRAAERAVDAAERAVDAARSDWEDEVAAGELRAAIAHCKLIYGCDAADRRSS